MRGHLALAAVMLSMTAGTGLTPYMKEIVTNHKKHGYPTDADFAALDKAQAKRDRRAAKRIKGKQNV